MNSSITRPSVLPLLSRALSLGNDRLFLSVVVASILPLWLGPYLPLVDLAQHAAQITALRHVLSGDPNYTELFQVNWFTPYLLGCLLLYAVSAIMPIAIAAKLIVTLAVVSVPLLTERLLVAAGGDREWRWLAIPCSFSFAFYWGFLSFLVAIPLALIFLIHTIRFVAAPTVGRGLAIAAFSVALFFCHIIILGSASLAALGYLVGAKWGRWRDVVVRAIPYAAPLPLIFVWLANTRSNEVAAQNDLVFFGPLIYRLMQLLAQPAGREDFLVAVPTVLLVTGAVILLPWLFGARLSRKPERWLPFALGFGAFLFAPHFVFGTAYFFQRLGVLLVPLWLMIWDSPQNKRKLDWLAIGIVVFWVGASVERFARFARETETFQDVLVAMEPGRTAAAMIYDYTSPDFGAPVYMHFPAWYQAEREGIVDFSFAEAYSQMVRYKPTVGARITEVVAWYPTEFRWDVNGGDRYDYFLVKASSDVSDLIFKEKRAAVELVKQSGWWWLYRNTVSPDSKALASARDAH